MTGLERVEQLERRRFVKWAAIGAAATATAGCASHPHRYAQPTPTPESRLIELGYVLPAPLKLRPGVSLPFPRVRVVGNRALISGHGPSDEYGNLAIKRELGSLDRVACWSRAYSAWSPRRRASPGSLR
jgi:TAT (twin-arginine translocation) pathway signal sequence